MVQPPPDPAPSWGSPVVSQGSGGTGTQAMDSARSVIPANAGASTDISFASQRMSTEDEDLAKAIEMSLQGRRRVLDRELPTSTGRSNPGQSNSELSTELVLSLNNEFDAINDKEGDTLIYIGPPSQESNQPDKDYRYVKSHFDRVYILKSRDLRLMGEDSRFTDSDLLSPTKSFRAGQRLRSRHPVVSRAEAMHGGKFTYYIDLRPPKEDEEAVILLTELTCTRGVLTWHLAKEKYGLAPLAVLGHDKFGVQLPFQASPTQGDTSVKTDIITAGPGTSNATTGTQAASDTSTPSVPRPEPELPPEYSELRHHSALERLLQAIQGNDPKLDSAPKLWTFFALARYYGCAAHHRISGWITTWIYTGNNANFIQNNPEVAYRIAMGIKSPDLLKHSFSILVGERALIEVYGEHRPEILSPLRQSVHGRKFELLDDDERNRIDHAASSLVKRIRSITSSICRDMDFLHESPAYEVLDNIVGKNEEEVEILNTAKETIREYVRSRIYYVLCQDQLPLECHEADLQSTLRFRSATSDSFNSIYSNLNQPMRLFTNTFWNALQKTQFDTCYSNVGKVGTIGLDHDTRYAKGLRELYKDDPVNGIKDIMRYTVNEHVTAVNRILYMREVAKREEQDRNDQHLFRGKQTVDDDPVERVLTVRNPDEGPESRPEPEAPFAMELRKAAPGSGIRSTGEGLSPTKRRKTSEDGCYADFVARSNTSAPSHSAAGPAKRVSFAAPSGGNPGPAGRNVKASENSWSPDAYATDLPLSAGDHNTTDLQQFYGNPTPTLPSWTSNNHRPSQPAKATTATMGHQPALPMRPKQVNPDVSSQTAGYMDQGQTNMQQIDSKRDSQTRSASLFVPALAHKEMTSADLGLVSGLDGKADGSPLAERMRYSELYKAGAGAIDSTAPVAERTTTAEEVNGPTAAKASSVWLPKNIITPLAGGWDTWGNEANQENAVITDDIWKQPRQLTSSKRVVKQAFSNANTPNNYSSSDDNANIQAIATPGFDDRSPINVGFLLEDVNIAIGKICSPIVTPPHLFHETDLLPTNLFDTLLCLNENEFRYLPLWAPDGNDDGTGGVFDETPVPNLDPNSADIEGFEPGRIRRGYQEADSIMGGSEYEDIGSSQAISTVGKASKLATDGTHTVTSISSRASAIDTVHADAGTVVLDTEDAESDGLSVIHVGEDATARHGDADISMASLNQELEFEDDDQAIESDTDTINGEDPSADGDMSASLKAFMTQVDENEDDTDAAVPLLPSRLIFKNAVQAQIEELRQEEKGKAKVQNFPHRLGAVDFDRDQEQESHDLPYRERRLGGTTQAAPAPTSPQEFQGYPATKLRVVNRTEADEIDDESTDDDYEFL